MVSDASGWISIVFEDIGLLIGVVLFFALSFIVGLLFGWVAWRILRSEERYRGLRKIAARLPVVFAAYMLACGVVFSIFVQGDADRIFFGDVYEPLPNGYTLKALAKMPAYGMIEDNSATFRGTVGGWVESLSVDGPFVFGAYSHGDDKTLSNGPERNQGYFALDTRNGANLTFGAIGDLNRYAGHSVHLTETFSFRSSDAKRIHQLNVERWIWFGPPVVCTVLYCAFLFRVRRRGRILVLDRAR